MFVSYGVRGLHLFYGQVDEVISIELMVDLHHYCFEKFEELAPLDTASRLATRTLWSAMTDWPIFGAQRGFMNPEQLRRHRPVSAATQHIRKPERRDVIATDLPQTPSGIVVGSCNNTHYGHSFQV